MQKQIGHFLPDYRYAHRIKLGSPISIVDFINREIPTDWQKWSIDRRRDWWAQATHGYVQTIKRDRITAVEIWCELFGQDRDNFKQTTARDINRFLAKMPNLTRAKSAFRCGPYGLQRGFHIG